MKRITIVKNLERNKCTCIYDYKTVMNASTHSLVKEELHLLLKTVESVLELDDHVLRASLLVARACHLPTHTHSQSQALAVGRELVYSETTPWPSGDCYDLLLGSPAPTKVESGV